MTQQSLEELTSGIVVDAYVIDEQLSSFCQVFVDEVELPHTAMVLGVAIDVLGFDYPADERRGLTARCRDRQVEQEVSLVDLSFPQDSVAAWIHAAFRDWLGLTTFPARQPSGWALGDA
ncbi:MAG: hypothetical protein ABR549_04025 [Mycobacteriales bacterium]